MTVPGGDSSNDGAPHGKNRAGDLRAGATVIPRPVFHFTPQVNWMNDPNGLVFDGGLWHLYFQYNPEGDYWGNMSWGHATSPDLTHWTEHDIALRYQSGEQIFSGSAVAAPDGNLTAYYTSAYDDGHQAQSQARSSDGGFTWTPDPGNPLLDRGTSSFRDPKIIRVPHGDGNSRWTMLTVEADDRRVLFYSSFDLHVWDYRGSYGPLGPEGVVWECPDLVCLPVDGNPHDTRWVLLLSTNPVGGDLDPDGSSMSWVIGDFDGYTFTSNAPALTRLDHGPDFYAGITFDNAPDGSVVMIGWMSNWRYAAAVPAAPWRGAMSLPRRLALRTVEGAPRLIQEPVDGIRDLCTFSDPVEVHGGDTSQLNAHTLVELRWIPGQTGILRYELHGASNASLIVEHLPQTNEMRIARSGVDAVALHPAFPSSTTFSVSASEEMAMLVSIDGPLVEIFVNGGECTASHLLFFGSRAITAQLTCARDGPVTFARARVHSVYVNDDRGYVKDD